MGLLGRLVYRPRASYGPHRAARPARVCGPLAPTRARLELGHACPAWAAMATGPGELGRFGPKGLFFFLWYFVNISSRLNV